MKKILILLSILLLISVFLNLYQSKTKLNQFFTTPKEIKIIDENTVIVKGSWIGDRKDGFLFGESEVNSVTINCNKIEMKCLEHVVKVKDNSDFISLFDLDNQYVIKEWNDSTIKGELVGLGMIFEMTINLVNGSAFITARDNPENPTAGDGTETAVLNGGIYNN